MKKIIAKGVLYASGGAFAYGILLSAKCWDVSCYTKLNIDILAISVMIMLVVWAMLELGEV